MWSLGTKKSGIVLDEFLMFTVYHSMWSLAA